MKAESEIIQSEALIKWLDSKLEGLEAPSTERAVLGGCSLYVALEHHKAIVLLNARHLYGPAAALLRLEAEAYVRGAWLLYCASEAALRRLQGKDDIEKTFGTLVDELEKLPAFNVGVLSNFKRLSWKVLNSLTHTGMHQLQKHFRNGELIPNFSEAEIVDCLDTANSFGLFTALAIAGMAGDEAFQREIVQRSQEFSGVSGAQAT